MKKETKLLINSIKFIKNNWWSIFYWTVSIICIYSLIETYGTWERWKWGYFSIDAIPPILVLIFIYFVNQEIRISKLEKFKQ